MSVQVVNEFESVAHRKLNRPWSEVMLAATPLRSRFAEFRSLQESTHDAALDIVQRDSYGFSDALIIASALEAKCTLLRSEEMQDG